MGELAALRPLRGGDPWSLTQLDQIQYWHVKGSVGGGVGGVVVVVVGLGSFTRRAETEERCRQMLRFHDP